VVESNLSEGAVEEEDAVVVATDAEAVEHVGPNVLPGRLAVAIHVYLGSALVEYRGVHVPVARAACASADRVPRRGVVARGGHADLRAGMPARRVAVAKLEAARVWPERVDDCRVAASTCHDDERDGLWKRLSEWARLEHRGAVELEGAVAVERAGFEDWHALVHARHVAVATQVGAALHEALLSLLNEHHVGRLCLKPHDARSTHRLPLAQL